jgi:hypothetical protein
MVVGAHLSAVFGPPMRLSTTRRIQRIRQKSAEAMLLAARIAVEQETFAVRYLGRTIFGSDGRCLLCQMIVPNTVAIPSGINVIAITNGSTGAFLSLINRLYLRSVD